MKPYTDCASQLERQNAQQAAVDAAVREKAKAMQVARMKARWREQKANTDRRRQLETNGNFVAVHTGEEYERFVMFCINAAGCTCRHVGGSGDKGADILIDSSSPIPDPSSLPAHPWIVVQCKFYSSPVGYDAVKEVYTAKALYRAERAWVVSNASYTDQARETARSLGIDLLHHADIPTALARV